MTTPRQLGVNSVCVHTGETAMSRQSLAQQEKQEAIDYLRTILEPGDTVYTILRHVSRSGMSRTIGVCIIDPRLVNPDKGMADLTGWAAKALSNPLDRDRWGVKVGGCGMDMGFNLVYNLSYTLFPTGHGCIGEYCPSNDHNNGDRDYRPHKPYGLKPQIEHWHTDGGYALRHKWL